MKDRELKGETFIEDAICKSCGGEYVFVAAQKRNPITQKWESFYRCSDCENESLDFKKEFSIKNSFKDEIDI